MHTMCAVVVPAACICWLFLFSVSPIDCMLTAFLFEVKQLAPFLRFYLGIELEVIFDSCLIVLCISHVYQMAFNAASGSVRG